MVIIMIKCLQHIPKIVRSIRPFVVRLTRPFSLQELHSRYAHIQHNIIIIIILTKQSFISWPRNNQSKFWTDTYVTL